jgi:hypothetical protein
MDVMPDHALMLINESAPLIICSSSIIMDNLATDTKHIHIVYLCTVSSISASSKVQGASSRSRLEL